MALLSGLRQDNLRQQMPGGINLDLYVKTEMK